RARLDRQGSRSVCAAPRRAGPRRYDSARRVPIRGPGRGGSPQPASLSNRSCLQPKSSSAPRGTRLLRGGSASRIEAIPLRPRSDACSFVSERKPQFEPGSPKAPLKSLGARERHEKTAPSQRVGIERVRQVDPQDVIGGRARNAESKPDADVALEIM